MKNPVLKPDRFNSWEEAGAFNGCPIKRGKKTYLLYRAVSSPHYHTGSGFRMQVSDIGIAESANGISFANRKRFIVPEEPWERFGCEDPRVTHIAGMYYIFYTALSRYPFSADGIKVGVALSRNLKTIKEKHLVTPFNAKAMALFPEKINGKYCAILTAHTDMPPSKIAVAYFDTPAEIWSNIHWARWHSTLDEHIIRLQRKPEDQIEVGAPPIKTRHGWLLIYSYIRNYFSDKRIFGIEAALLDLRDPQKIIAKTRAPLMTPEEDYEMYGQVPGVIFPSGTMVRGDRLRLYYGAADTGCAVAEMSVDGLINHMRYYDRLKDIKLERAEENPILSPSRLHPWEAKAVFNPAVFYREKKVHIVYRAMSENNISVLGYATSADGVHIDWRSAKPIYVPRESFEQSKDGRNSGCEDPRITTMGSTLYMCYTAYDGKNLPRIALTSIALKDFLGQKWNWARPVLISPPEFDNKDACIFPEKVGGKYLLFHRMGTDIDIALVPHLRFDGKTWLEERRWLKPRQGHWDGVKVGIVAPPVKTKKGWILLYHGISGSGKYRVGAVLLDLKNPVRIISRTDYPLLEPNMEYERNGLVSNVVFPCGNVVLGERIYVYYGGADKVIGVASMEIQKLLKALQ